MDGDREPIPIPPHTFGPSDPKARSAEEDELLYLLEQSPNRSERRRLERELRLEDRRLVKLGFVRDDDA